MSSTSTLMNRLREMILSGELAPGQRLTENALAERLAVSRTPVRNALFALAADGLVETVDKRGFAVKAFSERESLQALELRALLEGHAARIIARDGVTAELLEALEGCLEEGDRLFRKGSLNLEDELAYGEMNQRFHDLIVQGSRSPLLIAMIDRANRVPYVAPSVIVFRRIGLGRAFELLFYAHGTHHAIVDAIRTGDAERAELLFREHAHQQRVSMFERRSGAATDG